MQFSGDNAIYLQKELKIKDHVPKKMKVNRKVMQSRSLKICAAGRKFTLRVGYSRFWEANDWLRIVTLIGAKFRGGNRKEINCLYA